MTPTLIQTEKARLRLKCRNVLMRIGKRSRSSRSREIQASLLKKQVFRRAKGIFTYLSRADEISTTIIIDEALRQGKRVYVPKVDLKAKRIRIYRLRDREAELLAGTYGIEEPDPARAKRGRISDIDLVIVPGLAFDGRGRRLGRGGGYFDRFLKRLGAAKRIGLAFSEQRVKHVPVEEYDVPVDNVIWG